MNKRVLVAGLLVVTTHSVMNAEQKEQPSQRTEKGFHAIFDGKTLDGWTGNPKYFRVQENAIVAGTMKEKIPRNEFITYKQSFTNFELRLQAKLIGEGGNAGIQIRSRRPTKEEMAAEDAKKRIPKHEMIGYQVDMGKAWNNIWWGKLYDESRRRKVLAGPDDAKELEKLVKWDDWNDYRIRATGNRIQIWLNGVKTVDYRDREKGIAREGLFGLQIHGGPPSEAWYKDIRVKRIERKAKTAKSLRQPSSREIE